MSTFNKVTYHIIFSTKRRYPYLSGAFCEEMYRYIGGIIRSQKGHLIEIGGIEDHVHLLAELPLTKSISEFVKEIKGSSSKWSNQRADQRHRFEWQKGFSIFSVSYSQIEGVRFYIQNQRQHHQTVAFQEEYIKFLNLHQIKFELRYLFEGEQDEVGGSE